MRRQTLEVRGQTRDKTKTNSMFLKLKHKSLNVYEAVSDLATEIYRVSLKLPSEEKFNMVQQIRRAALSVKLNLAEGCTRKSEVERRRYLVVARGSIVEIDAALETAVSLNYLKIEELSETSEFLNKCFAMLSKMIGG